MKIDYESKATFKFHFHFIRWSYLSLGLHVDLAMPLLELHLPFGFLRLGWSRPGILSYDDFAGTDDDLRCNIEFFKEQLIALEKRLADGNP